MKKLLTLLTIALFSVGCASMNAPQQTSQTSSGELDYGDYTSQTLTTKAWDAYNAGDYMTAIKYTEKTAEMYQVQALEMQESLKTEVQSQATQPAYEVHKNWALNDVGTGYFIKGESLMKMGMEDEALESYKMVKNQLYYAQTWDPRGWFWSPAEAVTPKILQLTNDF